MKKFLLRVGKVVIALASVALIFFLSDFFEVEIPMWLGGIRGFDMFLLVNNKLLLVREIASAIMQVVSIYAVYRLLLLIFRKSTAFVFVGLFLYISITPILFYPDRNLILEILFRVLIFIVLYEVFGSFDRSKAPITEIDINEEQIAEERRKNEN